MKVVVAGNTGLVGSAISSVFRSNGFNVIPANRKIVDLRSQKETLDFFHEYQPDAVIDSAARVGGIGANNNYPVDFLIDNISIQNNLMLASHQFRVKKFVFLGSSCIYPRNSKQPIKEEYLLDGHLEQTNSAYSIAKIAGIELVKAYRRQYQHHWISMMPTNLYGPNDNFNLDSSHVLPALIRRFVEASQTNTPNVTLWGTGEPLREFLHVDDLALAVLIALSKYDSEIQINVGSSREISIKDLALLIAKVTNYPGEILWDPTKPDGTPRKVLDSSKIRSLGWKPQISLEDGIVSTVAWFRNSDLTGGVRK
jgi:GDP-L-fucose synthase